ncbi:hypothetical protein [Parasphingorhabdus sp.]|uniref:hypothetical protein n=1 Tax=Parasphingorhabdus sp. TaxID=2709688 RepID=UPI003BB005E8
MHSDRATVERDLALEEQRITEWLESEMGCSSVSIQRMHRWRPIMQVDVTRDGKCERYFLKGERTWPTHPYSLEYERDMQKVLGENGIKVPKILGWIPDPATIVMEWVDGARDAGLIQQAIENGSEMDDDRWQASLHYMEILAQLHKIPVERFAEAGAELPASNEQLVLGNFERFHAMSEQVGISDPFIAFMSTWLRRNCLDKQVTPAFLTGDCGQFMSKGPDITCLMDFEIGHIGDPMRDLACFRGRHPIENLGDLPSLFRQYEAAAGNPLDWHALAFHTAAFLTEAYYGPLIGLHDKGPGGDWVESYVQVAIIGRRALEALAELKDIQLQEITLPAAQQTPLEDLALTRLNEEIMRLPLHAQMQGWQRNILASLPQMLLRMGHYKSWRDEAYCQDVRTLTQQNIAGVVDADSALMAYIKSANSAEDPDIVGLLHRKLLRDCLIIAGPKPPVDHIALAPMEPVLHLASDRSGS